MNTSRIAGAIALLTAAWIFLKPYICRYRQQRIPNGTRVKYQPPTTFMKFLGIIEDAKLTSHGWSYKCSGWHLYLPAKHITVCE
jgi:hypothetical protein